MKLSILAAAAASIPWLALAAPGPVSVAVKGPKGEAMGQARLTEGPRGVLVRLELTGLKPGWHGVHFHAKGACSDPKFESAGSHVHAGAAPATHGLLNPKGDDSGDLPNVYAGADGSVRAEIFTTLVSLSGGGRPNLIDTDGSALVVHAMPDDYTSQPIGGAGDRVACGVIKN